MATKTRGMTQTSTINNARTRAGKRKAGNAGTRQQQMNSVTSARTRNQKKKQINKHSRASTPIASSPASVAHPARSPSVVGLAAEELALNENLKKGWRVLKSYLDNEASADDVHDVLQRVNDPELDRAFAEIMGCEPDEHSRHNNLYEKVEKKFLELENTADIRDRYVKLRNRESEPSDLNLDGILEWYRKEILEETAEQRAGGYTKKEIEKLCGAFINRGRQLYEARQLCSIGWLVDPVSALAVPWGADPLYVAMRDANPAQVTAQAVNYGTMFHSQLMLQKQGGLGLDPVKQGLVNRFVDDGTDKVVLRGLLKDVLLLSLREIRPNKDFKQMKWGSAFADLCYKEKVKLINYPVGMKPIGPPGGIRGSSLIPLKYVKVIVKQHIHFWQQELREYKTEARRTKHAEDDSENGDSDNGDDKDKDKQAKIFEEDLVQFVLWDDDEKELSLKEQANVGILLQEPRGNNNPVVLAKVLHSKIFLKQAVAHNISIELPDGMQEEDEEETIDEGQDGEGENKGEGEDNGVEEDNGKGEDDQGGEDGSEGEDNGEGKERPKKQVWAGKTDQSKKRKQSDI
ncbi:hypothetical protein GGU11DRAFT_760902 [Lentinula aff. detonsa]|nr:hypothetical protein GGU11DRAFT_760902 [Lentinula aff. detonsa]